MKTKKSIFQFSAVLILLLLIQSGVYACPICNRNFYKELLGQRANTLGGQELLEAIRNQSIEGQPSSFVVPDSIINRFKFRESNSLNSANSTEVITNDSCPSDSQMSLFSFINLYLQSLIFNPIV